MHRPADRLRSFGAESFPALVPALHLHAFKVLRLFQHSRAILLIRGHGAAPRIGEHDGPHSDAAQSSAISRANQPEREATHVEILAAALRFVEFTVFL